MAEIYQKKLIRAARVLANLSQADLAQKAGIGRHTIMRLENAEPGIGIEILEKVSAALEQAGIEFLPPTEKSGPGIRFRDKSNF